jgi:hypothetical protein
MGRILSFCFIALLLFSCKKEEEPINKFETILGFWDVEETRTNFIMGTEDSRLTFNYQMSFRVLNEGFYEGPFRQRFEWAIQCKPGKLLIATELNASDSTTFDLYFADIYSVNSFSENEFSLNNEEIFIENDTSKAIRRILVFDRVQ